MANIIRQTTELALHMVRPYVTPDAVVIDATCGNGHDTLALAQINPARLYAFDIQEEAVRATTRRLEDHGFASRLADGSFIVEQLAHENLLAYFSGGNPVNAAPVNTALANAAPANAAPIRDNPITAVLFNLGYLPGGDKERTTQTESTLAAVQAALNLLTLDGLICITMYSGHPEGKREKTALLDFASDLDPGKWHTSYISMPNQKHDPPEILLITRKR